MKKVIVTGGAGYIGQHVCKQLQKEGYYVVIIDRDATAKPKYSNDFYVMDISNEYQLTVALEHHSHADAIIHFAASAYVGESVTDPGMYYRNNVAATEVLLSTAAKVGIRNIIFSSSCATYGIHDSEITEDTPQDPVNPYGFTKLVVERMLKDFEVAHGIKHIALRYFNAAGSSPELEIGENHDPETHVIPLLLKAADYDIPNFSVMGSDYDTPDGTCIRSYIHVEDLATAHCKALQYLLQYKTSNAFNLSSGSPCSVNELIEKVKHITGKNFRVLYGPRRAGDPASLKASYKKAEESLGWTPQYNVDDMILHAWQYKQQRKRT
jgi:UDP-glucose-4-epimerase GalE